MDLLLSVGLPLAIAFIMFALGTGLTGADFVRVAQAPRAFAVGLLAQVVVLPLVAFALLTIFPTDPALAVGVMILAACPGGTTSNILTRLAGGTVALSVSLTAIVSLLSVITVPLIVVWALGYFEGSALTEVTVLGLGLQMFAITTVPVLLGMALRLFAPGAAGRAEPWLVRAATVLFALIVIAALAANWSVFIGSMPDLGAVLIGLLIVMLPLGFLLARAAGLTGGEAKAISIECGIQNGTLGIAVGALVSGAVIGPYSLPSGVYGVLMYLVTVPVILLIARRL
ncbi:bile acid:sodium symporter family protein [Pseudaestuariivita atlantica]|uniref:Bile acid:sodium symporter n=1 Tax=Pseudaestuariivita atlantica TaxID=1317121 RepID=A0A0L1JRV8_9RHOB|nr:bile acid:sodium symporter family protein [Pseudaestuariivita atlantica]KNG94529.1 hypothetical protein ATO11_03670 [Pseudaestuariivita atlantica]